MTPPKPFCFNPKKIKAFVLGCDPTNFSDNGKPAQLDFAFGITQDNRYFKGILTNLNQIGLHLEDIYVQNLVTEYQEQETAKNKNWKATAKNFIQNREREFDLVDESCKKPVFITSKILYDVLLKPTEKIADAKDLYDLRIPVPIPAEANWLGRPLIPLFRHYKYQLKNYPQYIKHIKAVLFFSQSE
ncbi:hypothetical protein [uncultured Draconibacterium sp.]|uniref:hypothetical protein n=1 Tax=uncultured Draconibacterium sp. TaxID=1573823 RepID=UPI003216631D